MLEVVGVDVVAGQRGVRQDVVLKALDLQIDAFLRQYRLGLFEDPACGTLEAPTTSLVAAVAPKEARVATEATEAKANISRCFSSSFSLVN